MHSASRDVTELILGVPGLAGVESMRWGPKARRAGALERRAAVEAKLPLEARPSTTPSPHLPAAIHQRLTQSGTQPHKVNEGGKQAGRHARSPRQGAQIRFGLTELGFGRTSEGGSAWDAKFVRSERTRLVCPYTSPSLAQLSVKFGRSEHDDRLHRLKKRPAPMGGSDARGGGAPMECGDPRSGGDPMVGGVFWGLLRLSAAAAGVGLRGNAHAWATATA